MYANRRRIKSDRGQVLRKKRGEIAERSNAHCYETGGLRRVHVRRRDNVTKRVLIQAATYNLALVMRTLLGAGTPKRFASRLAAVCAPLCGRVRVWRAMQAACRHLVRALGQIREDPTPHLALHDAA